MSFDSFEYKRWKSIINNKNENNLWFGILESFSINQMNKKFLLKYPKIKIIKSVDKIKYK